VVLDIPAFVYRQDWARGRLHAGSRSGRLRVRLTCDGAEVPLQHAGRSLAVGEILTGQRVEVSFVVEPGEYRAHIEDLAGGSDEATARVEEPGRLQTVARSSRILEAGNTLAREEDPSILELRVLPGLERPLTTLGKATTDYAHHCCEQTAAKIVAGCALYVLAETDEQRDLAEASVLAGLDRETRMWLPGRGFKMYPELPDQPHPYLTPLAAAHLRHLALVGNRERLLSPALRAGIDHGLTMAADVSRACRLAWPPSPPETCADAYSVVRFGNDEAARTRAVNLVRRRTAGIVSRVAADGDGSRIRGAVLVRSETAYAAAVLLRAGQPGERARALALANAVLQEIGPEGRLYSTVDSVAALALMDELRDVVGGGEVEIDGRRMTTAEAVAGREPARMVKVVTGIASVEVTRRIVEEWDRLISTVALEVTLEKDGRPGNSFTVGDALELRIRLTEGYQDGDLVWVCLPDALSWVMGGGQVKRFAVDLVGRAEVRVPLAATGTTGPTPGSPAAQHFAVCVRNMFEEERAGNPGLLKVRVTERHG
jgi:hypothetical protein